MLRQTQHERSLSFKLLNLFRVRSLEVFESSFIQSPMTALDVVSHAQTCQSRGGWRH
jgi:hypothetical protein